MVRNEFDEGRLLMIGCAVVLAVTLLLVLGTVGYVISIYNGLVRLRNNIDKSWSNIDVLLKQRFDELPKLVEVCRGYMEHERQTLEAVIKARSLLSSARSEGEVIQSENAISQALKSLFAVVENYPNLKADASFRQLQNRISELEDQIADRREFFNESVNLFNIRLQQFPDLLVARSFHFTERRLWEIAPEHRADVAIDFRRT